MITKTDFGLISSEIVGSFFIPLIIGIFTLAFPILFQTANRIDEKYNSTRLVNVFYKENVLKYFVVSMISCFIFIIIWFNNFSRVDFDFGIYGNYLVDNSVFILLLINVILVLYLLFKIMIIMKKYYDPLCLFNHLERIQKNNNMFLPISDLLFFSISQHNKELRENIDEFYVKYFLKYRDENGEDNKEIVYPPEYYDLIIQANEIACKDKQYSINNNFFYPLFMIDYIDKTLLSQYSYSVFWTNIKQIIYHNNDRLFLRYLFEIQEHYKNVKDKKESKSLIEFNVRLGGLLLYKNKYELINDFILNNIILPSDVIRIISLYFELNASKKGVFAIETCYVFDEIFEKNNIDLINFWMNKFIVLLFLNYYNNNSITDYKTEIDSIIFDLSEIKEINIDTLKHQLKHFNKLLKSIIQDENLLNISKYNRLENKLEDVNNHISPVCFIENIINQLS